MLYQKIVHSIEQIFHFLFHAFCLPLRHNKRKTFINLSRDMENYNKRFTYFKRRFEPTEPAAALYYNDAKPDKIFYQGLALLKLERKDEANGRFYKLTNYGEKHLFDKVKMDYFAVSLPDLLIWEDSLDLRNEIHCKYMLALGFYGLGDTAKSQRYLQEVKKLDINHQGIQAFESLCAQV